MKKNDFDFISSKFEDENIKAPDTLSEESIKNMLDKGTSANNIVKFKPNKKRFLTGAVGIAAAIALVVVSLSTVNIYKDKTTKEEPPLQTASDSGLTYFSSYSEIEKLMKDNLEDTDKFHYGKYASNFVKSGEMVQESASDGAAAKSSAPSHSTTYKQVDEVDEADLVKTDGEYIYYISNSPPRGVIICSAKDGKTKKVSTIKLDEIYSPQEMFVNGNTLVVISSRDEYSEKKQQYVSSTTVYTYDISDKEKPKKEYEYKQSGYYTSSRMIGDCVYIVTDFSNYYYIKDGCIPCATNAEGNYSKLDIKDICAVENTVNYQSYAVIGAMDTKNGNKAKKTKAVIGASSEVYCNGDNLYIAGESYDYNSEYYSTKCTIIKMELDGINVKTKATGSVRGNVNNQFSMDEKDGYFRIATTAQTQSGKDINLLYVLDEKLNEVGRVKGFAKNEHIEAVRFIGDTAYVITYERTDPLFIIDLSDAKNPEILGEVKISGFSTMLHPIDENTLLGIGYATEENEFGEATSGLKLVIFDISNPSNPKVADAKEFDNYDSRALSTHKALVVNDEENYFAIPVWFDDYMNAGAMVFNAENGKINVEKKFVSDSVVDPERCVYIGNYIYVIDTYEQVIDSFEMESEGFTEKQLVKKATKILETKTNHKASEFSYISTDYDSEKEVYVIDFAIDKDTLGGDIAILLNKKDLSLVDIVFGE